MGREMEWGVGGGGKEKRGLGRGPHANNTNRGFWERGGGGCR